MFWPFALTWYLIEPEGWDANFLHNFTFDFLEAIIFTEIPWEHLDYKWIKLHYLYLPYLISSFFGENPDDWVLGMMFVTLFFDTLAFLTSFFALILYFPVNLVFWFVFFVGQFISLADLEHEAEAPLYEDEAFREWDRERRMID